MPLLRDAPGHRLQALPEGGMKLVLPWPDKQLTPNAKRRKHWRAYQPAIKSDRELGYGLTLEQLSHGIRDVRLAVRGKTLCPKVTFYPPDHRKRDDDGMIGAFKHLRDGICDALNIDDNKLRPIYAFAEPEKPGRVEVEL